MCSNRAAFFSRVSEPSVSSLLLVTFRPCLQRIYVHRWILSELIWSRVLLQVGVGCSQSDYSQVCTSTLMQGLYLRRHMNTCVFFGNLDRVPLFPFEHY